ncbi:MAG: DUF1343 domain-containing protein [Pirellulaceae bacterium]|jgi:uncharacterized protein YbbC (DUF1343 family)|nr:DUF1343 domain-containing protein [Pirellulaceae bacterium]MDP7019897.1 DUF1343 domain-containing protein [Pirellulaceae bacterium]
MELGLERCSREPAELIARGRFALLANHASVDRQLRSASQLLREQCGQRLVSIFSPQHGFWGEQQANMIESPHGWCDHLDLPIHSLYSETRRPTAEMIDEVDGLVIDLQDVGVRVYTFAWTMLACLEAFAERGKPVVVLDRPNPIGGDIVEGPCLQPAFQSFVGRATIPMRHGLTMGELARLFHMELSLQNELTVTAMTGWSGDRFERLSRHWIPPSPNLPTTGSITVYPGQVMLEGVNLSEGRGTTTPFEVVGAPFIDAIALCDRLQSRPLAGVTFSPTRFVPLFDKWVRESCGGVRLHVDDSQLFRPYRTTIAILAAVREMYPDELTWAEPPYEYEDELSPIDIISGSDQLRLSLDGPTTEVEIDALSAVDTESWRARTDAALIYARPRV